MERGQYASTNGRGRVPSTSVVMSRGSANYVSRATNWASPEFARASLVAQVTRVSSLVNVYQMVISGFVAASVLVSGAAGVWLYYNHKNKGAPVSSPAAVVQQSGQSDGTSLSSTGHSSSVGSTTATSTDPYKLKIPVLKLDAFMEPVGIDTNGTIAAPNNGNWVGWYTRASKPGSAGLAILDGHINNYSGGAGAFRDLKKITPGNVFYIELKNGNSYQYRVISVKSVGIGEANSLQYTNRSSSPNRMNLVTCDGEFNDATQQYDNRLIVQAEQIE